MLALGRVPDNHFSAANAPGENVKKIGKILRDPKAGPALLIVEGQQVPFSVPGAWMSDQPPVPGMSVELELGAAGEIVTIRPLSEVQTTKAEGKASRVFARLLDSMR